MGTEVGLRRRVKGLSEAEFQRRFEIQAQCRAALYQLRWGKGWACGHVWFLAIYHLTQSKGG